MNVDLLWGKTGEHGAWHPLIRHMVDAGVVAQTLWERQAGPSVRQQISDALGLSADRASATIGYLAALHDIGKATPDFQQRWPDGKDRLTKAGLVFQNRPRRHTHSELSAAIVGSSLGSVFVGSLARKIAQVLGAHHGIVPAPDPRLRNALETENGWKDVREEITKRLSDLFQPELCSASSEMCAAAFALLAGLVTVSDWISSNQEFFPYDHSEMTPASYRELSRQRAVDVVGALRWSDRSPHVERLSFRQLFPEIADPRPVQGQVQALLEGLSSKDLPALLVVEVPTGEGKTEAALLAAQNLGALSGRQGFYVAMPTRASSDQFWLRASAALAKGGWGDDAQVRLLYGHQAVSAVRLIANDPNSPRWPTWNGTERDVDERYMNDWFSYRKRGLLAQYGVGTVDQALLAALKVRHNFVRFYGLAGKVVILDEVHAYDVYMSTLVDGLLTWLAAIGSSVVLLSATLPSARREALTSAFLAGRGPRAGSAAPKAKYPRVALVTGNRVEERQVDVSARARRTVSLEWAECGTPASGYQELGPILRARLAEGGCAAVLCNTVSRAQAVYSALKTAGFQPAELTLLHSRFRAKERAEREATIIKRCGPGQDGDRCREAHVVVSTQIVEQSLDLDFDIIYSELAPVDLVIQRMGRLQRHERRRPGKLQAPTFAIVASEIIDGVPKIDGGSAAVYHKAILLKTWRVLQDYAPLRIPDDVEAAIEAVYGNASCLAAAGSPLERAIEEAEAARRDCEASEKSVGALALTGDPLDEEGFADLTNGGVDDDADPARLRVEARTRLARPSITVALLENGCRIDVGSANGRMTKDAEAEILARTVSLSTPGIVGALIDKPVPPAWRRDAELRNLRALRLDEANACLVGKRRIELSDELGVVIE